MPNNLLKSIAVMLIGGFIGYGTVSVLKFDMKNRSIASEVTSKIGKYQNAHYYFDVSVNTDSLSKTENGISTLKVRVTAMQDFPSALVYSWNLPQETEVVDGSIHSNLGEFKKNETKDFVLKVKGFSKELRRYLSFEIQGILDQRQIHREVLISSRIEDSFEYLVQQREKEKQQGFLKKMNIDKTKNKYSPENIIR